MVALVIRAAGLQLGNAFLSLYMLMQKDPQIIVFGGEAEDTVNDKFHTFGDLHLYHCNEDTWTQIQSPKG